MKEKSWLTAVMCIRKSMTRSSISSSRLSGLTTQIDCSSQGSLSRMLSRCRKLLIKRAARSLSHLMSRLRVVGATSQSIATSQRTRNWLLWRRLTKLLKMVKKAKNLSHFILRRMWARVFFQQFLSLTRVAWIRLGSQQRIHRGLKLLLAAKTASLKSRWT